MASDTLISVPDIGDFKDVEVIEVAVRPGDRVSAEQTLITLESDKASVDIPSPGPGVVKELKLKTGDRVSEGSPILVLAPDAEGAGPPPATQPVPPESTAPESRAAPPAEAAPVPARPVSAPTGSTLRKVTVPNIGDYHDVEVIDVGVQPGEQVDAETTLITLESDKASMDIPAPIAGIVRAVLVKKGDRVSEGTAIAELEEHHFSTADLPAAPVPEPAPRAVRDEPGQPRSAPATPGGTQTVGSSRTSRAYASPSVRRFARELGVDLGLVRGSGRKGRILLEDVKSFTKAVMSDNRVFERGGGGFTMPQIPPVDFSKFGPVETRALTRLKRLGAQNLHRSWINVPHVTQFDEADITELEEFRKSKLDEAKKRGLKLTLLTFLIKAAVVALKKYPDFNSSLTPDGESLVVKQYFHVGFAVNTDQGLVVPVIRDADQKGLFELAKEVAELADRARAQKLKAADMQGGCFSISSLGHVGGTGFTPIINTPEVAILGVSRAAMRPVFRDGKFEPRLVLPYALSYDHRVIDGVAAAEFTQLLGAVLTDIRQILL
jgi:pyruvate dehydrogenase E2 component (dihydrolipoamide acetyltransferase)